MLDKDALKRYAPKALHVHHRGFDDLLESLVRRNEDYRRLVENPFSVFRGGKVIPVIHLVALMKDGHWHYFRNPPKEILPGHRMVSATGEPVTEFAMQPLLQLEVVTDPVLTAAFDLQVVLGMIHNRAVTMSTMTEKWKGATVPAQIFSIPLAMMLAPHAKMFLGHRYTLYQHIFGAGHEYPVDGLFYVGITSRPWQKRWSEHRAAIRRGSSLKFHSAYRERLAQQRLTYVHHKVMGVANSLDELQRLEEVFVAGHWHDSRLLNMIPGGKAGLEYLYKHNMVRKKAQKMPPEDVERTLEGWLREDPRSGLPAPWVAENWKDPDYVNRVICGAEGRFTVEQVLLIRNLGAEGLSAEEITSRVGAKDVEQVRRLLAGKTYSRVTDEASGE
ncbi:TPA: hypothetical protein ACLEB8_004843 [Pseudomonas aeruginosa]